MGAKVQVLVPLENVSRGGGFRDVKAKYAEKTIGICMACRRPRRHRTRTASTTTSFSTHCLEPYVNKERSFIKWNVQTNVGVATTNIRRL